VTQTVWRQMVRLLASNKLKACERKRSWNNLWYYPGTAARRRSRYMDNLRAGRPEVRIPERSPTPLSKTVPTGSGTHTASHSMDTGVHSWGQRGCGMRMTTHLYLVPRLRIRGLVPLLPLHTFMMWSGPTLPLPIQSCH